MDSEQKPEIHIDIRLADGKWRNRSFFIRCELNESANPEVVLEAITAAISVRLREGASLASVKLFRYGHTLEEIK